MTADDKKWQAENDARTLADAALIMGDKKRCAAAQEAAKRMADDKEKEAMAMRDTAAMDQMYPTMKKK